MYKVEFCNLVQHKSTNSTFNVMYSGRGDFAALQKSYK